MRNDSTHDPLKDEVSRTLRELHAPHAVPPFDAAWAAAEQMRDHERGAKPHLRPAARSRGYALAWGGAAAAATLALAIVLSWQPPADRHPPLAGEPARDLGTPAAESGTHADEAAGDAARLASARVRPGFDAAGQPMLRAQPVMWYAPTDRLLQVASLSYTARPAVQTVYDPIHLEIRP